jgi:hypothetical protein
MTDSPTVLLSVIILGLVAWAVRASPMPPRLKTIGYMILLILLVMALFRAPYPFFVPERYP